jgi:hypothetical protein
MKQLFFFITVFTTSYSFAQVNDAQPSNKIIVQQDYRMQILAQKESDVNTAILREEARLVAGFRLMILNTNDRAYAMKIRAMLLQDYPDQKTYMWFANPYIKIKFGNFKTQSEAISYQKQISKKMNGANIYIVPETIELKPDKDFDPDSLMPN